jgi:tetratricopeptide (TPR) repeat protein
MTVDMCPFISQGLDKEPCPGCIIGKATSKVNKQNNIIKSCLESIRKDIEDASGKPDREKSIRNALARLKKLTAFEEEAMVEVTQKREVLGIMDLIEKNKPIFDENLELEYQIDTGDVLFNIGEYKKSHNMLHALSRSHPSNKKVWNNLGVTIARLGKDTEALEFYDRALEIDSAYGSAWFNKGKALFRLGMKKKALECFRKATKYSPENKSAWNNLGVTLRQLKRYKESIKCYNKALKIYSEYPWAWHNKGVALMELKRYKQAMQCFDRALQIDSNYEPAKMSKKELMRKLM